MRDMLSELFHALKESEDLSAICIKSFERPETLSEKDTSIVILPLGPPISKVRGSDKVLSKRFLYQVNVESIDRLECKRLQNAVAEVFERFGFEQVDGGLDEYIRELCRYVDARTYQGYSQLYEEF